VERGKAHFEKMDEKVLKTAAAQVRGDRERWQKRSLAAPGLAEYLDLLEYRLSTKDFFQPADSSTDAEDEAEGKLLWAQMYYAALYQGATALLEVDESSIFTASVDLPETDFEPLTPIGTTWGVATIATEFLSVYIASKTTVVEGASGFFAKLKNFFVGKIHETAEMYQFTGHNRGLTSVNYVALAVISVAVIGVLALTVGMITGDENLIRAGVIILSIVTIVVVSYYIVAAVRAIVTAIRSVAIGTSLLQTVARAAPAGQWFQGVGAIGFILGVAITWAAVAFTIFSNNCSEAFRISRSKAITCPSGVTAKLRVTRRFS
jgi:hypothetical protein